MPEKAPTFSLQTVATNRSVGIPDSMPLTMVLLFQDQNTVDAARKVNEKVRSVYKDSEDLIVASVVDLSAVPRFMYKMANKMLDRAYEKAAAEIPAEYDPADFIMLLPDWSGDVFKAFKVGDVSRKALMLIIDFEGNIVFKQQGGNLGKAALRELDKLV